MERKYYLRGLGIGIAVTAIIMGFALSKDKAMTNDEIIARAKELGMVENTVLSDAGSEDAAPEDTGDDQTDGPDVAEQPQNDPDNVPDDPEKDDAIVADDEPDTETDIDAKEQEEQVEEDGDEETDPNDLLTADDSETGDDSDSVKDTESEVADNHEDAGGAATASTVKVITINSGDSSYTVAKKLADVGVVSSASTFDTFLCQNGYDKSLRTGTFSIPTDASDEQIARIVTGRE